jgi:hypothetical protein
MASAALQCATKDMVKQVTANGPLYSAVISSETNERNNQVRLVYITM